MFVFGSDRLGADVADVERIATVNLHAGFPERYRSLDTLLWATHHRDFDALGVTMHHEPELDGRGIVLQTDLPIDNDTRIWHLRTLRTSASADLATMACAIAAGHDRLPRRPLSAKGRHYSHMTRPAMWWCNAEADSAVPGGGNGAWRFGVGWRHLMGRINAMAEVSAPRYGYIPSTE